MSIDDKKTEKVDIEELKDELGKKIDLHTLHDSPGGKLLIDTLVTDVLGCIDRLSADVETLSHTAMISLVCKMKERIDVIKSMTSAKSGEHSYQDLITEALKTEAPDETPGGV